MGSGSRFVDPEALRTFQAGLNGRVLLPGDQGYEEARHVWNGSIDRHPAVIARCSGAVDVMQAVRFARENELPLAVRGGGHGVAGPAVCDGGLVVDLSPMKGIRVDPVRRVAMVQPGCVWGDLDHETQAFGMAVPGGIVSSTGVAGFTLGGGFGWISRRYGLACDNLLACDVVTAAGDLVRAGPDTPTGSPTAPSMCSLLPFDEIPTVYSDIKIPYLRGAIGRVPEEETAFGHRLTSWIVNINTRWEEPGRSGDHIAWTRALWQQLEPWAAPGVYVNFLDDEGEGRAREAYAPGVWDHLVAVKGRWDPDNVFRLNQNIKP